MRRAFAATVLMPVLLAAPATLADCEADLAALQPEVDQVTDADQKQLPEFDLAHARQELNEGDEDECLEAVDHANKLLHGEE